MHQMLRVLLGWALSYFTQAHLTKWNKEGCETLPVMLCEREWLLLLGVMRIGSGKSNLLVEAKVSIGWIQEFEQVGLLGRELRQNKTASFQTQSFWGQLSRTSQEITLCQNLGSFKAKAAIGQKNFCGIWESSDSVHNPKVDGGSTLDDLALFFILDFPNFVCVDTIHFRSCSF